MAAFSKVNNPQRLIGQSGNNRPKWILMNQVKVVVLTNFQSAVF